MQRPFLQRTTYLSYTISYSQCRYSRCSHHPVRTKVGAKIVSFFENFRDHVENQWKDENQRDSSSVTVAEAGLQTSGN